ncbi:hypothetical protein SprV_0100158500 [Sparganum proliferum]
MIAAIRRFRKSHGPGSDGIPVSVLKADANEVVVVVVVVEKKKKKKKKKKEEEEEEEEEDVGSFLPTGIISFVGTNDIGSV